MKNTNDTAINDNIATSLPLSKIIRHGIRNPFLSNSQRTLLGSARKDVKVNTPQGKSGSLFFQNKEEVKLKFQSETKFSEKIASSTPDSSNVEEDGEINTTHEDIDIPIKYPNKITQALIQNFSLLYRVKIPDIEKLPKRLINIPFKTNKEQRKVLFLDIDETILHVFTSNEEKLLPKEEAERVQTAELVLNGNIRMLHFLLRPHLETFLKTLSPHYEINVIPPYV
jgi:hypothetical protein